MVRGQSTLFLTALEGPIVVLDPAETQLVADPSPRNLRASSGMSITLPLTSFRRRCSGPIRHPDSLAPGSGVSLLESLDDNAHKHAFRVSEDLKYAIREAIEILGNEAVRQIR
jgi:hypothetical protein